MLAAVLLAMAIVFYPSCSADSVFWIFATPGCSGSIVSWEASACWSKPPDSNDAVTIDPPDNAPFSVSVNAVVRIRSLTIKRYTSVILEQALNVSESCQVCGTVSSAHPSAVLSCAAIKSCPSFGAALLSGSRNTSLVIHAAEFHNVSLFAEASGKISITNPAVCWRCTLVIAEGAVLEASRGISAASAGNCTISNSGRLVLGGADLSISIFDCIVVSASEIVVRSSATITQPARISGLMMLQPAATMTLTSTVEMQSLQISPTRSGQPAFLSFLLPPPANMSVAATVSSGLLVTFDSCPETKSFLNISSSADIDWNCPSSSFSGSNPSSLRMLDSARIRFGWLRSVRINADLPAKLSQDFVSNPSSYIFLAHWSNIFNMQDVAAATIASNLLRDYSGLACYSPPSLSITLSHASAMLIQGASVLLFGVASSVYNSAVLNVSADTSYLQSVSVQSAFSVDAGSLYVSVLTFLRFMAMMVTVMTKMKMSTVATSSFSVTNGIR